MEILKEDRNEIEDPSCNVDSCDTVSEQLESLFKGFIEFRPCCYTVYRADNVSEKNQRQEIHLYFSLIFSIFAKLPGLFSFLFILIKSKRLNKTRMFKSPAVMQ